VNVGLRSYYAEGSKTLAYEIAEQLGWEVPDVVVCPIASGSLYTKLNQGFSELIDFGVVEGSVPRLVGAQAAGCAPVATAFADGGQVRPVRPDTVARSLAIGSPADGDLAVTTAHETGGAIHAVAEEAVGEGMALLAETAGVFGETAAGVTVGALREAVATGTVGADERVVLLVTGDGLKTPGPVADRLQPVRIPADADALLESLAAA
jgi:threonine synthase